MLDGCRELVMAIALVSATGCGFPDHSFVEDSVFYGSGGANGAREGGSLEGGNVVDAPPILPSDGGSPPMMSDGSAGEASLPEAGVTDAAADGPPDCDIGLDRCGDDCVDLLGDVEHCGNCVTACDPGEVCSNGSCGPACPSDRIECAGNCVNPLTNPNFCGNCTTECAPNQVCENSTCVIDCGALTRCGNQCVNTDTDRDRCGSCSNACGPTQVCSGGVCRTTCAPNLTECSGECVDLQTDDRHCNGCGEACDPGEACVGGSCTRLVENCQNGTDDDRDGDADCADSDCTAGYTCAATPAGWEGPVALWSGSTGSAPSCSVSGGYSVPLLEANTDLVVPPGGCPACTCTPSAGAFCDSFDVRIDTSATCALETTYLIEKISDACRPLNLQTGGGERTLAASVVQLDYSTGSCVANQGPPSFPLPRWNTEVVGCAGAVGSDAGCAVGECLPKPSAPFGAQLCVYRSGQATCPGTYPNQMPSSSTRYFSGWSDGRGCTCGCGPLGCGGEVRLYTDLGCTQGETVAPASGTCAFLGLDPTPNGALDTRSANWFETGPQCGAGTSQLTGAVLPASPITVCCQ